MHSKKILVIDDDEMNLQIAKMILQRKLPCEVLCASNGVDGLEILRNEIVNLVLLDIMMPDPDGIETLQEIRGDELIKNIPVMMLTASGEMENVRRVAELGVKDYIRKPFMPADLVQRVEKKLAEIHSAEVLLLGDDETELRLMRELLEENFTYDVLTAETFDEAIKFLREGEITLVIACAEMKFIDGFKVLAFMAADEKFSEIPFALTTSGKLLELIEKINSPQAEEIPPKVEEKKSAPSVEEKISEEPPKVEQAAESVITRNEKKKVANVVTNLIGYELDLHI